MLADEYPHLKNEWMTEKNHPLQFDSLTSGSSRKTWWKCNKGHEWQASVATRRSSNCPYCSGRFPAPGKNDLATVCPELVQQWHPTLNQSIKLDHCSRSSDKKVWWLGECGHEWEAVVKSRVKGSGCPYCSNMKVLEGFNDFPTTHPTIANQWHPTKNSQIDPKQLTSGNDKKVWWLGECGHEWEAVIKSRTLRGQGCPYCSGRYAIPGETDIATTHPELARQWHPTLNTDIDIATTKAGTSKKLWWVCEKGHEWQATGNTRLKHHCPYCAGKKAVAGVNSIDITHPHLLEEWDYEKNTLTPQNVTAGSEKKIWWTCNKGHSWETLVINRTVGKNCVYCAGRKVLVGDNDFATKYPHLVKEWHPTKNKKKPTEVTESARYSAWWKCSRGHEWKATLYTRGKRKHNCAICFMYVSKPEEEIKRYIKEYAAFKMVTNSRSVIPPYELDIYLPETQIAIEFNGLYWHSEANGKSKYYHYDKWKACKEKGIELIQIWEDDWKQKPELVKKILSLKLEKEKKQTNDSIVEIEVVTQEKTEQFFSNNHIQNSIPGDINVGLYTFDAPTQINKLTAVVSLKYEKGNQKKLILLQYAADNSLIKNFVHLLIHIEQTFIPSQISIISENALNDNKLYEITNFEMVQEIEPDYKYVVKNKRVPKSSKPENNDFPHIWDAGKTKWIKRY